MDDDGAGYVSVYTHGTFSGVGKLAEPFSFEPSGDAELEKDLAFSAVRPKAATIEAKITLNNEQGKSLGKLMGFDVATGEAVFRADDGSFVRFPRETLSPVVVPTMDSAADIARAGENDDA